MSVQTEIRIGSEFVGYRIDELIGRGGMGVVYRAYDLRLKRTVALKLMAPELALDQRFRERFSREAELAMSLEHPNVVPIHDAGDIDGRLYLAMRHVEGTDLKALLQAEGALDPVRAACHLRPGRERPGCGAREGLVHRDVKPSNVLLDASEHVYLADFGLTRRLDEQGGPAGEGRSVGTPAYLAPEQIEGGPVDGRADVYSLGCLLYECLTGETPFARGSRLAVAWAHLEEEPPSASERRPELPEAIDAVIRKAMAKEPDDRYTTCAALITAAEEALGLRRPPTLRRHRLSVIAAVATLLLLAAVLVAAVVIRGTGDAGAAAPAVTADTLVRIDPATNKVSAVVDVGPRPSATAVGGRSVWVYNDAGPSVTEIDAATEPRPTHNEARARHPADPDAFTGPVLAADPAAPGSSASTRAEGRISRGCSRGPREARVPARRTSPLQSRSATAPSGWSFAALATTRCCASTRPPARSRSGRTSPPPHRSTVSPPALAASGSWPRPPQCSTGSTLARQRVTGRIDLGNRAARPEVVLGSIWVGLSDTGGDTVIVDPRTLRAVPASGCCSPEKGYLARPGTARSGNTTPRTGPSCGGTVRPISPSPTSLSRIRRSTAGCA